MSLFSGLYVGTTALKVASDALNTTSHNISNADTPGYTRQQVSQSTRHYNILSNATTKVAAKEIGMGVSYGRPDRSEIFSWIRYIEENRAEAPITRCLMKR